MGTGKGDRKKGQTVSMKLRWTKQGANYWLCRFAPCLRMCRGCRKVLRNINSLDFKNDRSGSIVATGDHGVFCLHPVFHDGPALQAGVDIAGNGVPCFRTEGNTLCSTMSGPRGLQTAIVWFSGFYKRSLTAMPEIVLLLISAKDKFITHIVTWAFPAVRNGTVLLLQFRV